jgi:protoporphyrinogen oxidase
MASEIATEVLILGGGLAGMATAWHVAEAGGVDSIIVERESRAGGWAKTDWDGDWGSDRGIHVLYFRDDSVRDFVEEVVEGEWTRHEKNCVIDSAGVRTPYPFHAHLRGRPERIVRECVAGLWDASLRQSAGAEPPSTFAEWIDLTMGEGVRRHFMEPYNTKMWTIPPTEMSCDWMGDFLPPVDRDAVLEGVFGADDDNMPVGLNAYFYYPTDGISGLADRLARRLAHHTTIMWDSSVVAVDAQRHIAVLSDGTSISYRRLVSSMPLDCLVAMVAPSNLVPHTRVERLDALDLVLVDIGVRNPVDDDVHWAYLPDADVLPYRVHLAHALSPRLAPPGCGLYCAEVSHSRHRPLRVDPLAAVVDGLIETGWIVSKDDIVFRRVRSFERAYVLPTVGFRENATALRSALEEWDILSIGRFGEWTYSNMEDALISGREAAARLVV